MRVGPPTGWGGGGSEEAEIEDVGCAVAVGGMGRAPGWGGGGREGSAVVVAGTEAGMVRVGGGFWACSSGEEV